jgi:hypothetical protein
VVLSLFRALGGLLTYGNRRLAWLVWRGAYLTQTVSWRNKLLIPIYWYVLSYSKEGEVNADWLGR